MVYCLAMYIVVLGFIKVAVFCGVCSVLDVCGLPMCRLLGVGFGCVFFGFGSGGWYLSGLMVHECVGLVFAAIRFVVLGVLF